MFEYFNYQSQAVCLILMPRHKLSSVKIWQKNNNMNTNWGLFKTNIRRWSNSWEKKACEYVQWISTLTKDVCS